MTWQSPLAALTNSKCCTALPTTTSDTEESKTAGCMSRASLWSDAQNSGKSRTMNLLWIASDVDVRKEGEKRHSSDYISIYWVLLAWRHRLMGKIREGREGIWKLTLLLGLSSSYHLIQCLNDLPRGISRIWPSPKQFYQLESWTHKSSNHT